MLSLSKTWMLNTFAVSFGCHSLMSESHETINNKTRFEFGKERNTRVFTCSNHNGPQNRCNGHHQINQTSSSCDLLWTTRCPRRGQGSPNQSRTSFSTVREEMLVDVYQFLGRGVEEFDANFGDAIGPDIGVALSTSNFYVVSHVL